MMSLGFSESSQMSRVAGTHKLGVLVTRVPCDGMGVHCTTFCIMNWLRLIKLRSIHLTDLDATTDESISFLIADAFEVLSYKVYLGRVTPRCIRLHELCFLEELHQHGLKAFFCGGSFAYTGGHKGYRAEGS